LAPRQGNRPRKEQFSEIQKLSDLDRDLGLGRSHTGAHIRLKSTHTPNYIEIGKNFLWTYVRMDTPEFQSGDDLKINRSTGILTSTVT